MCAGGEFAGTFQNCEFRRTAVYVVHGARVALRGCTIDNVPQGSKGSFMFPLLIASGDGTLATLNNCRIGFCLAALVVDCGAALVASDCDVLDADISLLICGVGASAAVHSCNFYGMTVEGPPRGPRRGTLHGRGAAVCSGALVLERCTFDHYNTAVAGSGASSRIEMREVCARNCTHALSLERHAVGATRDCVFKVRRSEGTQRPTVAVALGARTCTGGVARALLQMERTHLQATGRRALEICPGGGAVAASLCRLEGPAEVLVCAVSDAGGTMSLEDCAASGGGMCVVGRSEGETATIRMRGGCYEGPHSVCFVDRNAVVSARGVDFIGVHGRKPLFQCDDPMERGMVDLARGARAWLHGCRFHNGNVAVHAVDAELSAVDVCITGMLATASGRALVASIAAGPEAYKSLGYLCWGGQVKVHGGVIEQCIYGVVTCRSDAPGAGPVSLEGLVMRDCVVGVEAHKASELAISECEFRGPWRERGTDPPVDLRNPCSSPEHGMGVHMKDESSGTVTGCVFEGFEYAFFSRSTAKFAIQDCEFTVSRCGIFTASRAMIEDSRFVGATGHAADGAHQGVNCGGGNCELRRCRFHSIEGDAIWATACDSDAEVTVRDTRVVRCDTGLSMTRGATFALHDVEVQGTRQGVKVYGRALTTERLTVHGAVEAVDVECRAGPMTVYLFYPTLRESRVGVRAAGHQIKVGMFSGVVEEMETAAEFDAGAIGLVNCTRFVRCRNGIQVGDAIESGRLSESKCPTCGLSGQAAVSAAFRTLTESGGGGVADARCAHAGALSRVTMQDVCVDHIAESAVLVHPHGHLEATRVTATGCGIGFTVRYHTVRSSFVGCKAVGCGTPGVSARQTDALQEQPLKPIEEIGVEGSERMSETNDSGDSS